MIVFIYCCFLFLLLMYHRNRTLLALDIYVFVLSNGHRLHSACSHHPGRSRLDRLQGPLDYCKWFPFYGPLCSGVGILAFGSASKFPISMAHDEATSLLGVLRHPPTHLPSRNFRQGNLDLEYVFCLQQHQDRSHISRWSSS